MRLVALFALILAFGMARAVPPLESTSLRSAGEPEGICGIWETTAAQAVFRIDTIAGTRGNYSLTVLHSPELSLVPGTQMGTLVQAPTPGLFDAKMKVFNAKAPGKTHRVAITLSPDGTRLTFRPYRKNRTVSIRRLIPYLFRIAVIENDTRPADLDGAVRLDCTQYPVEL